MVDAVYTEANRGRFTLKLMKCQAVVHLFREAPLSGEVAEVECSR